MLPTVIGRVIYAAWESTMWDLEINRYTKHAIILYAHLSSTFTSILAHNEAFNIRTRYIVDIKCLNNCMQKNINYYCSRYSLNI